MVKKNYPFIFAFLFCMFLALPAALAQCPGCVINTGCTASPAKPTICPDTLPDGTAMMPYSEDISFYLPATFVDDGTGYTVTMNQLKILTVTGLPYGLNWQTNSGNNTYYPSSNPPTTERGCAKMCGTPIIPGNYMVTVFIEAEVTAFGIGQTVYDNFAIPLTILPNSTSNSLFSITNPMGCEPLSTGFQNLQPSNGNPGFSYLWSFGNGNQSNLENPPAQNYTVPGNYVVSLQTIVDTLPYSLTSVSVLNASGCDDGIWSDPDFYFILRQGATTIYTSAYVDNDPAPVTFSFSPINLNNVTYSLLIYEWDSGLLGDDDHCGTVTFNGHNAGTHTLVSGSLSVSVTITHPVINQTASDTIHVFPTPAAASIIYWPNDSICSGDSVLLSIAPQAGCTYQWFRDTSAIFNAIDPDYPARQTGTYYCEIMNTYGCRTYSNNQIVTVIPVPPKPTFWIIGNTLNTNISGFDLQWFFEGDTIPGANGMTHDINATGNYYLMAVNDFGCTSVSDTIFATYIGMDEKDAPVAFRLFPNPNKGSFTLEFNLHEPMQLILRVSDLLGRNVYEEFLGEQNGFVTTQVNLGNVNTGIYTVTIEAAGRQIHQRMSIY